MPTTHFSTNDTQALLTGLTAPEMRALKWAAVTRARGIYRTMILTDLEYRDIRAEVRLNPDVAGKHGDRYPTRLVVEIDENLGPLTLTTEWTGLKASLAAWLEFRAREDSALGGDYNEDVAVPDGLGNLIWNSYTRRGARDYLEFRLPGDTFVFATS